MTRVAIFTDTDLTTTSDLATALTAVIRHAPKDLHARILTAADFPADTADYFAAASISLTLPWNRRQRVFWPRLRPFTRQLHAADIDVIHIATSGPVGLAGRWLARRSGTPVVGSVHPPLLFARDSDGLRAKVAGLVERLSRHAYDGCQPVLVPSRAARDLLAARGLSRLETWERGVDTRTFAPHRASAGLRDEWHVDHRRPAILIPLSCLTWQEASMLESIRRRLHRHALAHQFVCVRRDGDFSVDALSPDCAVVDDPSDDELAVAMASCDLCLCPSASPIVSGAVLEAQACGLPAVVADAGGAMEQILPERTGLLARAGDIESIATAVVRLLRQPDLRSRMGRAAREYALVRDWPAMLQPLHAAWRAAGRSAGPARRSVTAGEAA